MTLDEAFVNGTDTIDAYELLTANLDDLVIDNVVGATQTLSTSADIQVLQHDVFDVSITHINGSPVGAAPYHIEKDDLVVFESRVDIPAGGAEDVTIASYLPGPLFAPGPSGACLAYTASSVPGDGEWTFAANDPSFDEVTDVTIDCNPANNRITFTFSDFDIPTGQSHFEVAVRFGVTATDEPMVNGLQLVDVAFLTYGNTTTADVTDVGSAAFVVDAPNLVPTLAAQSTTDAGAVVTAGAVTNIDAGGVVTYKLALNNNGNGTAQTVEATVNLPSAVVNPAGLPTCAGAACGYDISYNGKCTGTPDITSNETRVRVSGMQVTESSSGSDNCEITFKVRRTLQPVR